MEPDVPLIGISAKAGRTDEQKAKLYRQIAQQIQAHIGFGHRSRASRLIFFANTSRSWLGIVAILTTIQYLPERNCDEST